MVGQINKCIELIDESIKNINIVKEIINFSDEKMRLFCQEKNIVYYQNFRDFLVNLTNNVNDGQIKILESLNKNKQFLNVLLANFESEWERYNAQYKNFVTNKVNQILSFESVIFDLQRENLVLFNWLDLQNKNVSLCNNLLISSQIDYIYERFKYGEKNYIVFGKNGSGKTSLLKKIKSDILNNNSFVLPADRSLKCNSGNIYQNERNMSDLNQVFESEKAIDILTIRLFNHKVQQLDEAHKQGILMEDKTIEEKFCEIFDSLHLDRKVKIENEAIFLYDDEIEKYSLQTGSDGEKSIILIILAALLVPENAYFFIDEPENHLNGALMIELFNKIEELRSDIKFVYLTHNIDFIESRNNCEIVYLKKTAKYNTWEFETIENFSNIDIDIILSVAGTKKPIIFCEGNNISSIDSKIYSNVYRDYTIIPCASCEKIIENTKAFNSGYFDARRKAYGIIDNDFRTQTEIDKLKAEKIYSLYFNEIENILMDEEVLKYIDKINQNNNNIEEIKTFILDYAQSNTQNILNDFVGKIYRKLIKTSTIKYNSDFETIIDETNLKNKQELLDCVTNFSKNLNQLLEKQDFSELMKIIPGKFILQSVSKQLGFCNDKAYLNFFINHIDKDIVFQNLVSRKLPEFE